MINYRKVSTQLLKAYFDHKKSGNAKSVTSYSAGFNSFDTNVQYKQSLIEYQKSNGFIRKDFVRSDFRAGWVAAKELAG